MPLKTASGDIGWLPIENLTQRNRRVKKEMTAKQIHL